MKVCLFDPGLENNDGTPSSNLGDLIIQEAVKRELKTLFPEIDLISIATHSFSADSKILEARNCQLAFLGGTNLLNSNMGKGRKWRLSLKQQILLNKSILKTTLFGVGWSSYQGSPNLYTNIFLKTILSRKTIHSVRDNYTKEKLNAAGINNVVNTGCPTMWPLINLNYQDISQVKSENVLLMLTDYAKNPELDKKIIELIANKYETIFVWPQGRGDKKYILELTANMQINIVMLEHSFESFLSFLNSGISFDYIGTRLHGGIKCLVSKRRSLIIAIDNRAKEIAKDTNLPTCERDDFQTIINWIEKPSLLNININVDSIKQWKDQFSKFSMN